MAGEGGAIRMGSEDKPVVLDPYQTIVEVGWPSYDYAMVAFSAGFTWEGSFPADWNQQTCTPHVRVGTRNLAAGSLWTSWLVRFEQFISFGTSARLRRKRKRRNEAGDVETSVEWVEFQNIANPPTAEAFGFPKLKTFGDFNWAGSSNLDPVGAAPAFESFMRDIDGLPVKDKDGEIVYVEGAEPGLGPTAEDPIPFVQGSLLQMYMWGWPFVDGPQCTSFTEGSTVDVLQAATLGAQNEFALENVGVSGLSIIVKKMKFVQVGLAMDWDSNIGILFERVRNDEPSEPSTV